MRIDEGMPATLVVGSQELGCFVKKVDGEYVFGADGTRVFTRVDEAVVVPWRSPYETEEESLEAVKAIIGEGSALPEPQEGSETVCGA